MGKKSAQTVTDKFLGYVFTTEFPMALRNPEATWTIWDCKLMCLLSKPDFKKT